MDWPDAEKPILRIEGDHIFEFDEPTEYTSRVLRNCVWAPHIPENGLKLTSSQDLVPEESGLDLGSDAQWDEWLKSSVFQSPPNEQGRSGYHIL
jgi:hypothetical protein